MLPSVQRMVVLAICMIFPIVPTVIGTSQEILPLLEERNMTLLDSTNLQETGFSFPVYLAEFGRQVNDTITFNLMLPPADDENGLCTVPKSIEKIQTEENGYFDRYAYSIALFVRRGLCPPQQKAMVAMQIRKVIPSIKVLILYDDDTTTVNDTTTTTSSSSSSNNNTTALWRGVVLDPVQLRRLVVAYPSRASALAVAKQMAFLIGIDSLASPYILDIGSFNWNFPFRLLGIPNGGLAEFGDNNGDFSPQDYFWLRAVLFGMLIVGPCVRAIYLWYAGGGRLHWRRNDRGRIVGLQHIPPMPYWLALVRPPSARELRDTLTEEQFASLPEIKYQPPPSSSQQNESGEHAVDVDELDCRSNENNKVVKNCGDVTTSMSDVALDKVCDMDDDDDDAPTLGLEKDIEKQGSPDVSMMSESDLPELEVRVTDATASETGDNNKETCDDQVLESSDKVFSEDPAKVASSADNDDAICPVQQPPPLPTSSSQSNEVVPESTPPPSAPGEVVAWTCTTCSICIDDFVADETLILLPRCQHVFHRDCIHPWLLERQGCCPTCKTLALPEETAPPDSDNNDDDDDDAPR